MVFRKNSSIVVDFIIIMIFNELVIIKVKENTNIKSDLKLDINISKNIPKQ